MRVDSGLHVGKWAQRHTSGRFGQYYRQGRIGESFLYHRQGVVQPSMGVKSRGSSLYDSRSPTITPMDVASQLRKAVNDAIQSGATRHSIAKGAGIEYATFEKWLDDHEDIRLSTVSSLASYLNLELCAADPLKAKDKVKAPALPAVDWGKPS